MACQNTYMPMSDEATKTFPTLTWPDTIVKAEKLKIADSHCGVSPTSA